MTTSPARNPVTFLSGGRYSVGCQCHLLYFHPGGGCQGLLGFPGGCWSGVGGTSWTVVQGQIVSTLPLSSVLCFLLLHRSSSAARPLCVCLAWPPIFELWVIIWNIDEVVLDDDVFLVGKRMSDIYVRG